MRLFVIQIVQHGQLIHFLIRLGCVVVGLPLRVREVVISIPGRVKPNTLKMVVIAALLGAQGCGIKNYD